MTHILITITALTTLWHGLALYHFAFFPGRTIVIFTGQRDIAPLTLWAMRFLGALNGAVMVPGLVALAVPITPVWLVPAFFCATNLSQTLVDFALHRTGITNRRFLQTIYAGDVVATLANGAAAVFSQVQSSTIIN